MRIGRGARFPGKKGRRGDVSASRRELRVFEGPPHPSGKKTGRKRKGYILLVPSKEKRGGRGGDKSYYFRHSISKKKRTQSRITI